MVVGTKSVDVFLKGVVDADDFLSTTMDSIRKTMIEDPEKTKRNIFVFSSDDIKAPKIRSMFVDEVANKHPGVKLIYIDRTRGGLPGVNPDIFDEYIKKPSKGDKQVIGGAIDRVKEDLCDFEKEVKEYGASVTGFDYDDEMATTELSEEDDSDLTVLLDESVPESLDVVSEKVDDVVEPVKQEVAVVQKQVIPITPVVPPPSNDGYLYQLKKLEGESIGATLILSEFAKAEIKSKEVEEQLSRLDAQMADVLATDGLYAEEKLNKLSELTEQKNKLKEMSVSAGDIALDNIIDRLVESVKNQDGLLNTENKPPIVSLIDEMAIRLAKYQEEASTLKEKIDDIRSGGVGGVQNIREETLIDYHVVTSDVDSIAVSYMLAKDSSEKGIRTLFIDLTNSGLLECFAKDIVPYGSFINEGIEVDNFAVVSVYDASNPYTKVDLDVDELMTGLAVIKEYYNKIIISVGLDQMDLINKFKELTQTFTCLVDCMPTNIRGIREGFGGDADSKNMVVLLNCLGNANVIKDSMDLSEYTMNNMVVLEPIQDIRSSVMMRTDPYSVETTKDIIHNMFNLV